MSVDYSHQVERTVRGEVAGDSIWLTARWRGYSVETRISLTVEEPDRLRDITADEFSAAVTSGWEVVLMRLSLVANGESSSWKAR